MVKIFVVAPFLVAAAAQPDVVGLLQQQLDPVAAPTTLAMRRDDLGENTGSAKPRQAGAALHQHSFAGGDAEDCKMTPKSESCLAKVKCPVVAALIRGDFIKNPTKATHAELVEALQAGAGSSEESSWLVSIDAMFLGDLNLYELPSNHIGNTGIRSKGFINETAFEYLWDNFHSVKDGKDVMCTEDMNVAAKFFRKIESDQDPGLDYRSWANWRNTIYGEPEGRDIMGLTMLALPLMFGDEYGETNCATKSELSGLYIGSKLPDKEFSVVGTSRFIRAAKLSGKVANAKWHIPFVRSEYIKRKLSGELPNDTPFNNKAILVGYIA